MIAITYSHREFIGDEVVCVFTEVELDTPGSREIMVVEQILQNPPLYECMTDFLPLCFEHFVVAGDGVWRYPTKSEMEEVARVSSRTAPTV